MTSPTFKQWLVNGARCLPEKFRNFAQDVKKNPFVETLFGLFVFCFSFIWISLPLAVMVLMVLGQMTLGVLMMLHGHYRETVRDC